MSQEATKAKNKSKFEELNITKDEIDRFSEAMKKEEFRKLLVEYAEEISDPKNREQYEKEITALEEERGQNVVFIHPETGFCMKTTQNGSTKCFINICKNSNVEKPTSKRETRSPSQSTNGKSTQGLVWYIPHTCSPPREDYDKSGEKPCIVYDVVFNPDSYRMAETNERFKSLLKNSAMETIEKNFNVKLDRANLKILKHLNFKGRPTATILRKPQTPDSAKPTVSVPANASNEDLIKPLIDQIKQNSLDKELEKRLNDKNKQPLVTEITEKDSTPKHATPVYKLVHRGHTDMQGN
jgi:dynein assembly factor 2